MEKEIQEKIDLLSKIDTENARFVVKALKACKKEREEYKIKRKASEINIKNSEKNIDGQIIDLDKIWIKPYFYTKMRVRLEELANQVVNTDDEEILKNSSKFLKKVIYNRATKHFEKPEGQLDIVEFIKDLDSKKINMSLRFHFVAEKIDDEAVFKENIIKKAIEIVNINDTKERYAVIYDEICDILNKNFVDIGYCDFKNNKCIAQRKHKLYPPRRKNGCCSMQIRQCPNLINSKCTVECVACKFFSCGYLAKKGIGYFGKEIVFLQAFFNRKQRKHFIFDFYQSKENVIDSIYRDRNN